MRRRFVNAREYQRRLSAGERGFRWTCDNAARVAQRKFGAGENGRTAARRKLRDDTGHGRLGEHDYVC